MNHWSWTELNQNLHLDLELVASFSKPESRHSGFKDYLGLNVKFIEDLRGFLQAALRVLSSKRRFEGSGETGERASSYRHRRVWTSGVLNGLTVTGFGWGNSDPKLVWSRVERQMLTRAKSCLPSHSIPFPDSHLQLSSLPSKLRFGFRTTSCTKNMFKFGADLYYVALRHELISCHRSGDLVIFWIKGHPIFFWFGNPISLEYIIFAILSPVSTVSVPRSEFLN